jgi:nitroreductase
VTEASPRHSDYPIDKLFLDRWSPRAFTSEEISEHDLLTLLEAARWAPSAYNSQPWRFIYGRRGTPHFDKLLSFLVEFNQSWAKTASALVILVSNSTMLPPGKDAPVPSHSHSMDAGAAWASLALQGLMSGWHTHGMVGFDMDRAFAELGVPAGYRVEQAIAIGRKGDKSQLPEMLAGREMPSDRLPLSQIAMEGSFKA